MSKIINLETVKILETLVTENNISISYQVLDDLENVIINNRINIKKEDLPQLGQNAIDKLQEKILAKIITKEL